MCFMFSSSLVTCTVTSYFPSFIYQWCPYLDWNFRALGHIYCSLQTICFQILFTMSAAEESHKGEKHAGGEDAEVTWFFTKHLVSADSVKLICYTVCFSSLMFFIEFSGIRFLVVSLSSETSSTMVWGHARSRQRREFKSLVNYIGPAKAHSIFNQFVIVLLFVPMWL